MLTDQNTPVPLMTSKAEKRALELLKVARRVVADGGFKSLSMQALADAGRVAVGTPYRYFPSKGELCARLVARVSEREFSVLDAIASSDGTPCDRLRAMTSTFTRRALEAPQLAYAIIAEPVDPEVEEVRLEWRSRITRRFGEVLAEGAREEMLQIEDPEVAAACFTGAMMESVIATGKSSSSPTEMDRIADQVASFCVRGVIRNQKAADVIEMNQRA